MTGPIDPLSGKGAEKIVSNPGLEPEQIIREQPSTSFDSQMKKGAAPQGGQNAAHVGQTATPMDLARSNAFQTAGPSFNSLIAQAKGAQDTLGVVGKQLQNPNLKLKRSQTHLLRNKLTDANTHLNTAGAKLGLEPTQIKSGSNGGHIERFLSYINAGQDQFGAIQSKLQEMSSSGQQLNAGDMLLLQSKMGVAQQEIEYSSTLLSKVIDSIKQIMAVQV
jgi:hypothetical protein